jgi:hypothetical protein
MPEGRSDNGSARARGAKDREAPLPFLLAVLGWTPRDAVAFVVGIVAVVAILVNSLSLQSGSHPAPLFESAEVEKTVQAAAKPTKTARLPQVEATSAPVTAKLAAPHALRTPGEIMTDVQRELARRGYYNGPVDGLYGQRTDGAIRDDDLATRSGSRRPKSAKARNRGRYARSAVPLAQLWGFERRTCRVRASARREVD